MNKKNILMGINNQELKIEMSKIIDQLYFAVNKNIKVTTNFLTPTALSKAMEILSTEHVVTKAYGGMVNSERNILIIAPTGSVIEDIDFPIDIIEVKYNEKFSKKLSHSDYLGSVLGCGLKREIIGDIIVEDGGAKIIVHSTITDFLLINLEKIGRVKVSASLYTDYIDNELEMFHDVLHTTVSSLRVDVILGKVFNLSRSDVKKMIAQDKAFINWIIVNDGSKIVNDNEMLTLRGHGRIKFVESSGVNKKGRVNIAYIKY